jgi:hypothetical protein
MESQNVVVVVQGTVVNPLPTVYATVTAVQYPPGYYQHSNHAMHSQSYAQHNFQSPSDIGQSMHNPVGQSGMATRSSFQTSTTPGDLREEWLPRQDTISKHLLYRFLKFAVDLGRWLFKNPWYKMPEETNFGYGKRILLSIVLVVFPAVILLENTIFSIIAYKTRNVCGDEQLLKQLANSFLVGTISLFPLTLFGAVCFLAYLIYGSICCLGIMPVNGFCFSGYCFFYGIFFTYAGFAFALEAATRTADCFTVFSAGELYFAGALLMHSGLWSMILILRCCPGRIYLSF